MEILILIYVILFGVLLGSFLGLCTVRLPLGESIVSPRSHCRRCSHILSWYENLPILSYLLLRGKCRICREKISPKYFMMELISAVVTAWAYLQIQPWPLFLIYLILFIAPMLLLMFLDWEALILPDIITLPGILAGFLVHWLDGQFFLPYQFGVSHQKLVMESLVGAVAGSLSLFLLGFIYKKLRRQEGLGMGDVKLGAMIGAFFGWKAVFFIFFLASVLGTLFGVLLIIVKKGSRQTPLPFGSFLAIASLAFLLYGDLLLKTYLNLVRGLL